METLLLLLEFICLSILIWYSGYKMIIDKNIDSFTKSRGLSWRILLTGMLIYNILHKEFTIIAIWKFLYGLF